MRRRRAQRTGFAVSLLRHIKVIGVMRSLRLPDSFRDAGIPPGMRRSSVPFPMIASPAAHLPTSGPVIVRRLARSQAVMPPAMWATFLNPISRMVSIARALRFPERQ